MPSGSPSDDSAQPLQRKKWPESNVKKYTPGGFFHPPGINSSRNYF